MKPFHFCRFKEVSLPSHQNVKPAPPNHGGVVLEVMAGRASPVRRDACLRNPALNPATISITVHAGGVDLLRAGVAERDVQRLRAEAEPGGGPVDRQHLDVVAVVTGDAVAPRDLEALRRAVPRPVSPPKGSSKKPAGWVHGQVPSW